MNRLSRSLWLVTCSMFISMMAFGIVVPLLPIYAKQLGATGFEVGAIFAGFSVTLIFFLPLVGFLSDILGRKLFLSIGLIGLSVSSLLLIWARNPTQLILIRSLQGAFAAMHLPVAQAYVGDITPKGSEGAWMGRFNAVLFASLGSGPVLGGMITDLFGLTVTFLIMSFLLLIAFIFTFLFLPEVKARQSAERRVAPLSLLSRSRMMKGAFLFQFSHGLCLSCHMVLLPLFMTTVLSLSSSLVGLTISARSPISLLQMYTGRLSDRYDKKKLALIGMLTFAIFTMVMPSSRSFIAVIVNYSFAMLGISLAVPAVSAYVVEEGRKNAMGTSFSVFLLPLNVGATLGSILFGSTTDFIGLQGTFIFAGLLTLVLAFPFYQLIKSA